MPKFFLIDNSITGTGGHHYQYARYCLEAAEKLGYEPILATNQQNKDTDNLGWKVFPTYRNTFWKNDEHSSFLANTYNKFEKSKHKIVKSAILRFLGKKIANQLLDKKRISEFASDTENLFNSIQLNHGDVVFIPTSGLVEMFGILEFSKNNEMSKNVSWNFLFRRNIYEGSPEKYSHIYIKLRLIKNVFDMFLSRSKIKAYFYTDSEQLTQQYNNIRSVEFQTLPIPHTIPKEPSKKIPKIITITYLGDARTEKGYHHLPHIIQDMYSRYIEDREISFMIQSNYNIPEGEPSAVVARNQLAQFKNNKIQLITELLNSDDYEKLLLSSDIILLPYDSTNYYARSSGILAESLAHGIPVIVPTGSWLSRQFVKETYQYHQSLRNSLPVVESYDSRSLDYDLPLFYQKTNEKIIDSILLDWKIVEAHCWLRISKPVSHLLVTIYFDKENTSSAIIVHATQMTSSKLTITQATNFLEKVELPYVTTLIPINRLTEKIWIGFKHPYTESILSISKITVDFLLTDSMNKIPEGAVGLTFDDADEISDKLSNMIDHYQHYFETARSYSDYYYKENNAKALIQKIIVRTNNHE